MNNLMFVQIILDGLLLSLGLSVIVLGGMYLNPRLMLQDYPKEIQAKLPPITPAEKKQQVVMRLLFFGFILSVLLYSNAKLIARTGQANFVPLVVNTYFVFEVFNLFDLLILDYLIIMVLKPRFLFIPGTEAMGGYNTFAFHFKGFLKGLLFGTLISLIVAGVLNYVL